MAVLVLVGLLAGAATFLSPCVLPVLPVVLSVGAGGGRRAPVAMAVGLAVSFAVFTLLASRLLAALGLRQDALRWTALVAIAVAGASLVLPRLGAIAGRPFQPLAAFAGSRLAGRDGTVPGLVVGGALGLVWAPCAGPVLAAVTVLAAQQSVTADAVALTTAYAVGAALPLLAVALAGRRLTRRLPTLRRHAPALRRLAGATLLASALLLATPVPERLAAAAPGLTSALQVAERSDRARTRLEALKPARPLASWRPPPALTTHGPLGRYGQAPALPAVDGWLNVPRGEAAALEGRVVLLDFWTYSCINCVRTLPHLRRLDERYRSRGLTVLGVHTPEFAFERERRNVERAVRRHGLRYPVALDNAFAAWNAWGVGWWPSTYLVDREGEVRYFHVGEGAEAETEAAIRALLDEAPSPAPSDAPALRPDRTPEVYLGARRGRDYVQRLELDRSVRYRMPRSQLHRVSLGGEWRVEAERIVAGRDAVLRLSYAAAEVFVVLAEPASGRGTATVAVDGAPPRTLTVSRDDLYPLVAAGGGAAGRTLELRLSPGTAAYTFSFG